MKQDVIPGRYTTQWFHATKVGKYNLFCTEYCGNQHSEMGGYVYVVSKADYAKWIENMGEDSKANASPIEQGHAVWNRLVCGNCHGDTDTDRGPSLNSLVGRVRKFTDGSSVEADKAYIRESILDPYRKIVQGYDNTMPIYGKQPNDDRAPILTEDEVLQLYEYIRSLGAAPANAAATTSTKAGSNE
jgi:cytochrome c oxidase subunit 2